MPPGCALDLSFTIEPSDVKGDWVAHCLDYDVVSQGRSPLHALLMLLEATWIVVESDRANGRDPRARRAPDDEWARLQA